MPPCEIWQAHSRRSLGQGNKTTQLVAAYASVTLRKTVFRLCRNNAVLFDKRLDFFRQLSELACGRLSRLNIVDLR